MPAGRPKKQIDLKKVEEIAKLGGTDAQIAKVAGVSRETLNQEKQSNPQFADTLKSWKEEADKKVEESLYKRACGYTYETKKVFCTKEGDIVTEPFTEHVAPDPTSMIFWLKNRQPKEWRDKRDVEMSGGIKVVKIDESDIGV